MPIRPAQFDEAAKALEPVLAGLPPKVVAIDRLEFRTEEVQRIIKQRLACRCPVFVEGVTVLKVLTGVSIKPDFVIYVRNVRHPRGRGLGKRLDEYDNTFQPERLADHIVEVEHDG